MTLWEAIVLGIVQGLTEFLPISSTAHLAIVPSLLGWQDPGAAFTAVIQCGTLAAVVVSFRSDLVRITRAFCRGLVERNPWGTQDARLAWMMIVATIPIVVFGLLFKEQIRRDFRSLNVIAGALIGLAIVLALAETLLIARTRRHQTPRGLAETTWWDALVVGIAQSMALIPGTSRSGVTITGGLLQGLTRPAAARFSFLLSLPAIFAAAVHEMIDERELLFSSGDQIFNLVVSTLVAGVVGYLAIAFLMAYLRTHTTAIFIAYRIVLGIALLVLVGTGRLPNQCVTVPTTSSMPQAHDVADGRTVKDFSREGF